MRAQAAFFRSDFNECVRQGLLVYPFLDAWYSGNKRRETEMMLEFAIHRADAEIRQEAIGILAEMHHHFTAEQLGSRGFEHFRYIPQLIEHATGDLESFANPHHIYTPPESPKELCEVTAHYLKLHEKRFAALPGDPLENPAVIAGLLVTVADQCRPADYLELYHKHFAAPELTNSHFTAAKIYLSFRQEDQARDALLNYARCGFIPIEWTDVKPMAIFVDYSFVPLFTKEFLDTIYHLPVPKQGTVQ